MFQDPEENFGTKFRKSTNSNYFKIRHLPLYWGLANLSPLST